MDATSKQNGFLLIASLVVISAMLIMVSFYLSATAQDIKVASIVDTAPQAYYLAEAGIQDAFWKLKNDAAYRANFESDPNWSATFTRPSALVSGGAYTVLIENQGLAQAEITATSTIAVRDTQSRRVVRASVFKALSTEPFEGVAVYANNEIYGAGSNVQVLGGSLFANQDIDLNLYSSWETDRDASAAGNIEVSANSTLVAANQYDQNSPPVPQPIGMPQIDFDSSDAGSYKSRADQVYSTGEFKQMLKDYPVLALSGITYVTGNIQIEKGMQLTINGILVADGFIKIGNGYSSVDFPAVLTVNKEGAEPSGLITKGNITIGGFNADVDIAGLVYTGGMFRVVDGAGQVVSVEINGGIITQDMEILVAWEPLAITYDQDTVNDALGSPASSQILIINHWEEEY